MAVSSLVDTAGRPIERRLNRMERVVAAYSGEIDARFSNGMQIAFETADAAILGAREMQQRCAVLPQLSGTRLALRIGVHEGIVQQRSEDNVDSARAEAAELAVMDDSIIVSPAVIASLNNELRKLAQSVGDLAAPAAAKKIDWRREISSAAADYSPHFTTATTEC